MKKPSRIASCAVLCGARPGNNPLYVQTAFSVGQLLAKTGIILVYGGGGAGLMGAVARGAASENGKIEGVMPEFLQDRENPDPHLPSPRITADMASRKAALFSRTDMYLVLPGGLGTLDEFAEVLVNRQLGLEEKPICLLNLDGWADNLLRAFDLMAEKGFLEPDYRKMFLTLPDFEGLKNYLSALKPAN